MWRQYHRTALRQASNNGHLEVVQYLVDKCGASIKVFRGQVIKLEHTCRRHLESMWYVVEKCGRDATGCGYQAYE